MKLNILATSLLLLAGTSVASASLVTFTETFVASGNLGASNFSNATVTVTAIGDTANIINPIFLFPVSSVTFAISGEPTAALSSPSSPANMQLFGNEFFEVIGNNSTASINGIIVGIDDPVGLNGATFTSVVGPKTGTPVGPAIVDAPDGVQTDQGVLSFTHEAATATYSLNAVPEPAMTVLLGLGLLALPAFKRLRG